MPPKQPTQRPQQVQSGTAAILLALIGVLTALAQTRFPVRIDDLQRSGTKTAASRINPNTAPWWELAVLPGVGESLARRIVDHRDRIRAAAGSNMSAFKRPEDLRTVRGVGPATLERIKPFLLFSD